MVYSRRALSGGVTLGRIVGYTIGDTFHMGRVESFFVCDYSWEGDDLFSKLNPPSEAVWCEIRQLFGPFRLIDEPRDEWALDCATQDIRCATKASFICVLNLNVHVFFPPVMSEVDPLFLLDSRKLPGFTATRHGRR
jgi:hypothetical protein